MSQKRKQQFYYITLCPTTLRIFINGIQLLISISIINVFDKRHWQAQRRVIQEMVSANSFM